MNALSVILPALNAARTLSAALAAVGSGVEVIVADGGSHDATPTVAAAAGARVVAAPLAAVATRFPGRLTLRVSLDHYTQAGHESLRGENTWAPALEGLRWIAAEGIAVAVASRTVSSESESALRAGFGALFAEIGLVLDPADRSRLVLFPEMTGSDDVPEITEACWGILKKSPDSVMCATSRMVVKRKGAERPAVVACTLLPYDPQFELGDSLAESVYPVRLNHPHCAKFCVLGGAACSQ